MLKASLPYLVLVLSWLMLLFGGAYMSHPLSGMFCGPIIILGTLTVVGFFIGIVPSIDDVQTTDTRRFTGAALLIAGSVALGVAAYAYGIDLATNAGQTTATQSPSLLWIALWITAPLLIAIGAALKSKWTYKRGIPLVLFFAALHFAIPALMQR